LIAVFILLLSVLLYLIGLYISRFNYPDFIADYGDSSFFFVIDPLIFPAVLLLGLAVYLFAVTKHELLLLCSLIILGIYLWVTNSLIIPNTRTYDTYWHYTLSQFIVDRQYFTYEDLLLGVTWYLNYPFTGIFGAEFNIITNIPGEKIIYYFPILFTILLITLLYASTSFFFKNSHLTRAIVVLVFIIGNSNLQIHFAPQTVGLIVFAFSFYLIFKYMEQPTVGIKIMLILIIFSAVILHPLTSFIIGLILITLLGIQYIYKQKTISSSMVLLFFIFFFSWQVFWSIYTSTNFFKQLSQTFSFMISAGPLSTGSGEALTGIQELNPIFTLFRAFVHGLFIILATCGIIILVWKNTKRFYEILCFYLGPILFFVYIYFSIRSALFDRTIYYAYFPVSISVGYISYYSNFDQPLDSHKKIISRIVNKIKLVKIVKPFITYKKQILPVIFSLLILTSSVSIYAFGLQEGGAIVPTEDVEASKFMSNYDGGYKLIYKTGTIIIFYNLTSKSTVSGWKYWEEKQLPPDEREYITKPNVKYVILTKKLKDTLGARALLNTTKSKTIES
jgi:hypothetical protein